MISPSLRAASRNVRRKSTAGAAPRAHAPVAAPLRQTPAGASRASRRNASLRAAGPKRRSTKRFGARRGLRPIHSTSSALIGSSAPRRSSWTRTTSSSSPSLPSRRLRAEEMHVEQRVDRRRGARAAGPASQAPRWRMSSRSRGPKRSIAERNAIVCSGATAKPLARSSGDEIDEGRDGARQADRTRSCDRLGDHARRARPET